MIFGHTAVLSKKCNQPVYRHFRISISTNGKRVLCVSAPQSFSHTFVRNLSVANRKCRCWPNPPCHHHDSGSCNYKFHERVHNGGSFLAKPLQATSNSSMINESYSKSKLSIHKRFTILPNTGRPKTVLFDPASTSSAMQLPIDVRLVATSTQLRRIPKEN